MGLGKTLQTVAFVRELKLRYGMRALALIVGPLSTYPHWQRESERWAPSLSTVAYVGGAADRAACREAAVLHRRQLTSRRAHQNDRGGRRAPPGW